MAGDTCYKQAAWLTGQNVTERQAFNVYCDVTGNG
jgi:hypothetical protein